MDLLQKELRLSKYLANNIKNAKSGEVDGEKYLYIAIPPKSVEATKEILEAKRGTGEYVTAAEGWNAISCRLSNSGKTGSVVLAKAHAAFEPEEDIYDI